MSKTSKSKLRAGLYARVSTHDQQTLPMQLKALRQYAKQRGLTVVSEVKEIASGAKDNRPLRAELLKAARRREIDFIIVWRLDRWGRSLADLISTLNELTELKVGFVSLNESLDLTTPSGRAMAAMLAVFAEFEREIIRERVKAGIAVARAEGKPHGRPKTVSLKEKEIKQLYKQGVNKSEIARQLKISRRSVIRILK